MSCASNNYVIYNLGKVTYVCNFAFIMKLKIRLFQTDNLQLADIRGMKLKYDIIKSDNFCIKSRIVLLYAIRANH